jgi:signal transduction histidine kinase
LKETLATQGGTSGPLAFLVEGGEMGRLIRSIDWSATPLGPAESWPQSLRTTVSLCLASNFPISIAWGPKHVLIYNDGYWPVCGGKHPRSMGQDFSECWASAWPVIGEPFDRALAGHASFIENQRMFLDRNGYLEETFFTFSFSPIRDESGGVGGVLNPCHETTAEMLSERRIRALRDLAARTGKAKSVEEVLVLSAQILAAYDLDVPFVLLYARDANDPRARLVARTGLGRSAEACPSVLDLKGSAQSFWPVAEVFGSGEPAQVNDLGPRLGPPPCGPYPEPPKTALLLPITPPGAERPAVVLVAGVSPRLPLNEAYRNFYDLLAAGVTAAIANAQAYDEARRRAEALAEIDRAKTTFFSNVSHEFRTPLTLMLGPVEDLLARSQTDLSPAAAEQLQIVSRNGLRLLRLVNTLLDFSRIETGRVKARYQPTDLAAFTTDLASAFRAAIERAGLQFAVDCERFGESAFVDRDMWEKIVFNLLSNAFKFTFEGEITVRVRQVGANAELRVQDTGTGIPEAEMPRLFERFHRVQNAHARTHEGSGIGLALVQELVKLHGGSIAAESVPGEGTTFIVALPLGSAHLPPDQVEEPRTGAPTGTGAAPYVEEALRWLPEEDRSEDDLGSELLPPQYETLPVAAFGPDQDQGDRRPRVLVADDNADMRHYLVRLLAERYQVEAAADGEAALATGRKHPPDLVLTDVMMPRLDGFGLLRELRADPRTRDVPVIMLSARAGEESRIEGMEAGVDDYLIKPFSARELVARVGAHLQMTRMRRDADETLRASEAALRRALAEREALLKELHHRVKNNLQVIMSLLEMQAANAGHPQALSSLAEARNRVDAIASMHELLYQSDSFSEIDLSDYARRLVAHVVSFYQKDSRVNVSVVGDGIHVDLAHAVPLGLLLNELVSNACKHAFPGNTEGQLDIRLSAANGGLHVQVRDSGTGLPAGLDRRTSPTLGLRLVRMLAKQLGGDVSFESAGGTTVDVHVPRRSRNG